MYIVSRCSNKYFIDVQTCKIHDIHAPGIKDFGIFCFVFMCVQCALNGPGFKDLDIFCFVYMCVYQAWNI